MVKNFTERDFKNILKWFPCTSSTHLKKNKFTKIQKEQLLLADIIQTFKIKHMLNITTTLQ